MGEYAELALEREMFFDLEFDLPRRNRSNKFKEYRCHHDTTWMQRDETIILIKFMTTSHIENSMKMLEKANQTHYIAYSGLKKELMRRNHV